MTLKKLPGWTQTRLLTMAAEIRRAFEPLHLATMAYAAHHSPETLQTYRDELDRFYTHPFQDFYGFEVPEFLSRIKAGVTGIDFLVVERLPVVLCGKIPMLRWFCFMERRAAGSIVALLIGYIPIGSFIVWFLKKSAIFIGIAEFLCYC